MKSSLILCALLAGVLSVRAASLPADDDYSWTTAETTFSTPYPTTMMMTTTTPTPTPSCDTVPQTTPTTTPFTSPMATPATAAGDSPSQIMCHEGWEYYLGRCYNFVNVGTTWSQAQTTCSMLDSMLVSVHSAQEYGFLQQLTNNNQYTEAWLGGFYLQDQWLWIDGSWFYNNSWSYESQDSSNPCLLLNSYEGWSNAQCNSGGYPFICVKNSNVPPALLCPQGWTGYKGRCFYYNQLSLSWAEADTTCAGLDASLVSVHSLDEYFFLYQLAGANQVSSTWLGGFYLEDQWMWLDGSWFYQGFDTQMSSDGTYPCLSTYSPDGWTNYDCDQSLPSFCVKDVTL